MKYMVFVFLLFNIYSYIIIINASCETYAPHYFTKRERQSLCSGSNDLMPAECARAIKFPIFAGRNAKISISLCNKIFHVGPAACYNSMPKNLLENTSISLCQNSYDDKPAECAHYMMKQQRKIQGLNNDDIKTFCTNFDGNLTAIDECMRMPVHKISKELKLKLCQNIKSDAVLQCFNTLIKKRISQVFAVELCAASTNLYPINCFMKIYEKWSIHDAIQLCSTTTHNDTAECALGIKSSKIKTIDRISICKNTGIKTAECINNLSSSFSIEEKIKICGKSNSLAPSECISLLPTNLKHKYLMLRLCAKAKSSQPAKCFRKSGPILSVQHRVELCHGAIDADGPNKCVSVLDTFAMTKDTVVEVCRKAVSIAPAQCFNSAPFEFLDDERVQLCYGATSVDPAECARIVPHTLTKEQVIRICSGSIDSYPAQCAAKYPSSLSKRPDLIGKLCFKASSIYPISCYREAPSRMKLEEKVLLCSQADSTWPAKCANAVATNVPVHFILQVCQQINSITPAHCLSEFYLNKKTLTLSSIAYCRSVIPVPSGLEISDINCKCAKLVIGCSCSISLIVVDQYGIKFLYDNDRIVSVSSINEINDVEVISGTLRTQTLQGGLLFSNITFLNDGKLQLRFFSEGLDSRKLVFEVHQLKRDIGLIEGCHNMFHRLKCVEFKIQKEFKLQYYLLDNKYYLQMASCIEKMEEAMMSIEGKFNKEIILSIHPLSYVLLTGIGLPTESMTIWEKLQIDENDVTLSSLRRTYRLKSLDWHPDRWSKFPFKVQRKAEKVYQLLSEAYSSALIYLENDNNTKSNY